MPIISVLKKTLDAGILRRIFIPFSLSYGCCRVEVESATSASYDWERLGVGGLVNSPEQADVLLVSGWINEKLKEKLQRIHSQMAEPRSVIAIGACAISGSPYSPGAKSVVPLSDVVPVDVYVPGCPPRPEAILEAFQILKETRNPIKDKEKVIYAALRGPS